MKTPEGKESPAALAGVPPAAVLIAVAGEHTLRLHYEECIGRYAGGGATKQGGWGGCYSSVALSRLIIDQTSPPFEEDREVSGLYVRLGAGVVLSMIASRQLDGSFLAVLKWFDQHP